MAMQRAVTLFLREVSSGALDPPGKTGCDPRQQTTYHIHSLRYLYASVTSSL
jgi:hypothetical protein